jgi:hypothetical protein
VDTYCKVNSTLFIIKILQSGAHFLCITTLSTSDYCIKKINIICCAALRKSISDIAGDSMF